MEIWAALLGAVVGGIFTGLASWLTIRWQLKKECDSRAKEEQDRVNAVLLALYHEVKTVWQLYMESTGNEVDKWNGEGSFEWTVPMEQNYYSTYEGNIQCLGLVPKPDLRDKIVVAFTYLKALKDSYLYNNKLLAAVLEAKDIYTAEKETLHGRNIGSASIFTSKGNSLSQYGPANKEPRRKQRGIGNNFRL